MAVSAAAVEVGPAAVTAAAWAAAKGVAKAAVAREQ